MYLQSYPTCRSLANIISAHRFVHGILKITEQTERAEAANKLFKIEKELEATKGQNTLNSLEYRHDSYINAIERKLLRQQIFEELVNLKRPEKDDDIKLGCGGALPRNGIVSQDRQLYLIIGLPAAGKSGVSNIIADSIGAYIVDADMAKMKFPEYKNFDIAAPLLHEESCCMISGHDEGDEFIFEASDKKRYNGFLDFCRSNGYNIVLPKIGRDSNAIQKLAEQFKQCQYTVFLILLDVDREQSTLGSYKRYLKTNRYVPLPVIFDHYGHYPQLTYFRNKLQKTNCFNGFMRISSEFTKTGRQYTIVDSDSSIPSFSF